MTAVERIQKAAGKAIRRVASSVVTLLDGTEDGVLSRATIDRVNKPFNKVDSEMQVQGNVGVTIYFDKDDLTIPLRVGMLVQESDADETKHRIGEIKDLGWRFQCFCESEPIT